MHFYSIHDIVFLHGNAIILERTLQNQVKKFYLRNCSIRNLAIFFILASSL